MWQYRNDESSTYFGSGAPTGSAGLGSLYTDMTNNVIYRNTNGGTTWVVVVPSAIAVPVNLRTLHNATATTGTDTACSNGTAYVGTLLIPTPITTVTGISFLVGSVGGTDKVVTSLHDATGALLANSALAGATVGTAAQIQAVALTAPYTVPTPGIYFLALTFNGTTAKFRSIPAYCSGGILGNGVAQTFGTSAAFTPPTTFTADKVPIAFLY